MRMTRRGESQCTDDFRAAQKCPQDQFVGVEVSGVWNCDECEDDPTLLYESGELLAEEMDAASISCSSMEPFPIEGEGGGE